MSSDPDRFCVDVGDDTGPMWPYARNPRRTHHEAAQEEVERAAPLADDAIAARREKP